MRSTRNLVWRNLTAHPLRSILTALAIMLGVAMVLAAAIVGQAANQQITTLASEGPQVDLELLARDGDPFDTTVLPTLLSHPNIAHLSPSLRIEVQATDPVIPSLILLGVEPDAYQVLGQAKLAGGNFLSQPDSILLPIPLALQYGLNRGDEMMVETGISSQTLILDGRLKLETDNINIGQEPIVLVQLETAQTLAGLPGQIDRIAISLHPGVDPVQVKADLTPQLSANLTIVQVARGGTTLPTLLIQGGLVMVGLIILFAAAFVIMNAFAMSVTARAQEIGSLRALGMTRRQVLWQVMAEAGLLGLIGAAAGVPAGVGLAWLVMRLRDILDGDGLTVPWWGVILSVVLGLLTTGLGALQPAYRASRLSPLAAMRNQAQTDPAVSSRTPYLGPILFFGLLIGLPAVAFLWQPDFIQSAALLGVGILGLLFAILLLMPLLVHPIARWIRPFLTHHLGTIGQLAADNLARNKKRTALTAAALTIGLTMIIATSALLTASLKGGLQAFFTMANEDGMIIPDIPAMLASGEMTMETSMDLDTILKPADPALVDAIMQSGIAPVHRYGFAAVPPELSTFPGSPGYFVEPDVFIPLGNFNFFEGDPDTALTLMQEGPAVLIIPITAERLGVSVGDTIPVATPHGEINFVVAGIGGNTSNFTVFSYADGERYFDITGPSWLGIVVPEGEDVDAALAEFEAVVTPASGMVVFDMHDSGVGGLFEIVEQLQTLLNALLLLAVIVAALGVVNTMVINVSERGREIGLLRAVGATRRQVRQAVVTEAAILGLTAALIAAGLSLLMLALFVLVFIPNGADSVGIRASWDVFQEMIVPALRDWGLTAVLSLIVGPFIAGLAAYYPARQAAAVNVVEATRSEQLSLSKSDDDRIESHRRKRSWGLNLLLATRNLSRHRLRSIFSALAVSLGVAMTITADYVSSALLETLSNAGEGSMQITHGFIVEQFDVTIGMVGYVLMGAAAFLIFNAFAMSITERQQQIGALRALGMTRRQIMRQVLLEALLIGSAGTLVGLAAGPIMGQSVVAIMQKFGSEFLAFGDGSVSWGTAVLASVIGLGVTILSAWIPAHRATRVSPLAAMRPQTTVSATTPSRRQPIFGLLGILALFAYLAVAPPGEWIETPWSETLAIIFVLSWLVCLGLMLPTLIRIVGSAVRHWLGSRSAHGHRAVNARLIGDNIQRNRGRVILTILTLAVGLGTITGLTGFMTYAFDDLMGASIRRIAEKGTWAVFPFDLESGIAGLAELDNIELPAQAITAVQTTAAHRAGVVPVRFTLIPELSFFGDSYFTYVADPEVVRGNPNFFQFTEGDWETAMPIMTSGCGALVAPLIASRQGVTIGDTLAITGQNGPLDCTIAGIGAGYVNASIVGDLVGNELGATQPIGLSITPKNGVDTAVLEADLQKTLDAIPGVFLTPMSDFAETQESALGLFTVALNGMLLLAVVAAALGIVNTTVMSIHERRQELGLLRAVGATRRQIRQVVMGENALIGLVGAIFGVVAGMGAVVIIVTTLGGSSWGVTDLDLWPAAGRALKPTLVNGIVGILAAPLISAGVARWPIRSLLRGSAIATLNPDQPPEMEERSPRREPTHYLYSLAWRNLQEHRLRTILSGTAVALGVAMMIAADVIAGASRSAIQAADERNLGALASEMMDLALTVTGLVILAAAGFLIFNAFAMAITQRRRQIGALRSLGMTRRQVMRLVLVEAAVIGGIGVLLGVISGPLIARGIMALLRVIGNALGTTLAVLGEPTLSLGAVLAAALLGLGITLAATLVPAWQAARISPLAALRNQEAGDLKSQTGRQSLIVNPQSLIGALIIVALFAVLIIAPPGAWAEPPWGTILSGLFALIWLAGLLLITPSLLDIGAKLARPPLSRLWGAIGRLIADNLRRARRRIILTVLTLAIGLIAITGVSGMMSFVIDVLLLENAAGFLDRGGWIVLPVSFDDVLADVGSFNVDETFLSAELVTELHEIANGRAGVGDLHMVNVPELAFLPGIFSYVLEPVAIQQLEIFTFTEGDWETAHPIMESGCGLLVAPAIASKNNAGWGDTISVTGADGRVNCVIAGIGRNGVGNVSLISYAAGEAFGIGNVPGMVIQPMIGADKTEVERELAAAVARHPGSWLLDLSAAKGVTTVFDKTQGIMNGMLLLAILTAALGVINTTVMSTTERQQELGLLRAVGATRRQVMGIVIGEAALMGLVGGLLGLIAGVGLTVIFVVTYGGNAWGLPELPLWPSAWKAAQPALQNGLFGLLAAPLVSAAAAWLPARNSLRGTAVSALNPERQPETAKHPIRRQPTRHLYSLAWRNLQEQRLRAIFSAFAVALGVAMIVAAEVTSSGILDSLDEGAGIMTFFIETMDVIFSIIGLVILAAAGFLIFNAFAMTVAQRRKQIGVLRSLGMTRRQVLRQIQAEAFMIGSAGTLLGLFLGPLLGNLTLTAFRELGVEMGRGSASIGSFVLGSVMGLGITLLSVWVPARQATRISPLTALRQETATAVSHTSRFQTIAGILILTALWGYLAIAPPGAWSGRHSPLEWVMFGVLIIPWLLGVGLLLPALIGGAGRLVKRLTARWGGANGRLIADNLTRDRRRVTLTILTFAVGLTMINGMNGFLTFSNEVLLKRSAASSLALTTWTVYPFDRNSGLAQLDEMNSAVGLSDTVVEDFYALAKGRAEVAKNYAITILEISSPIPGFFSSMNDLRELTRPGIYHFVEGDWETAVPIMEAGCGLLLPPAVASRHEVGVGDPLILPGKDGPVNCTVAGIGSGGNLPVSVISTAAKEEFAVGNPTALSIWPLPGTDEVAFRAELEALADQHGDAAWVTDPKEELNSIIDTSDQLETMTYALLALAVVAAALGMVNTTVMSITERRHELGLLRAVGMTRRQATTIVVGEAALMGVVGGLVGLIAGLGITLIFGLSFGGIPFGLVDLPLWEAAWEAAPAAIMAGLLGIVIAPIVSAAAAYWPSRSVLRGTAIETIDTSYRPDVRQEVSGLFSRGSIRTRFVVGTAVLMLFVLVGLTAVILRHARNYLEETTADAVASLVEFNASMVEFNLPPDAGTLTLDDLQSGNMDADTMLQFRSLIDEMNAFGLLEFVIADQDDIVMFGFDMGDIGTVLEPLADAGRTVTAVTETDSGQREIHATAPIRNENGDLLGSVRLRMELGEIGDFLRGLNRAILTVGALILALGLALAWWATTPLIRATRQLAAGAAQVGQGRFAALALPKRLNVPLRVKLTAVMILILILLVGALEQVVLPIERRKVEEVTQDTLVAGAEWAAQLVSSGIAEQSLNLSEFNDLTDLFRLMQGSDIGQIQDLSEQMQNEAIAYTALVNEEGVVQLSDQFDLMGGEISLPTQTLLEETEWQGDPIWRITTPLRDGENNAINGAIQMGVLTEPVEGFLDESRNLLRLTGLIAILAGVILAQAIGGAVVAPVQRLAADTRRVRQGDLSVQFMTSHRLADSRDELAQLAGAFNEMVAGLQEREWLRDMFGRFVSQEVAEAIRTGQVKLEGENRVVSVLFCDIRGFTARSEKSTPAEIVTLLNEYLPVVVNAAQSHDGTVNKFGGDSTLVIYGAPKPLQESAYRAIRTALEMRQNLDALNERLAERGEEPIRIGVGISTGMVLAGAVGPPERQEYTVIGDTVNLASRIEALNKVYPQHGVLISGPTYEALGGRRAEFAFTDLGEIQIRGKVDAVRVWAVSK